MRRLVNDEHNRQMLFPKMPELRAGVTPEYFETMKYR